MRVLFVHNRYRNSWGEKRAVTEEVALLASLGHSTALFERTNDTGAARLAAGALWNPFSYQALRREIRRFRPDVVHCHNTFPRISPAAYDAARAERVPVVQTLHNQRLLCAGGRLERGGEPCELCVGRKLPWPAVVYGCYRGSRAGSAMVGALQVVHRALGTWATKVDLFVVFSALDRDRFATGGLPVERIAVKPNALARDPGGAEGGGGFVLAAGQLQAVKGIHQLLDAWGRLGPDPGLDLEILGDGPEAEAVRAAEVRLPRLRYRGRLEPDEVLQRMSRAELLVVPSVGLEGHPMVLVEARAVGLPVVVSEQLRLAAEIEPGETGYLVPPGDSAALGERLAWLIARPAERDRLRRATRAAYEAGHTPELAAQRQLALYRRVLASRRAGG